MTDSSACASLTPEKRAALGELKNLAGWFMDHKGIATHEKRMFIRGIALRMKALIIGEADVYLPGDEEVLGMLEEGVAIEKLRLPN